MGLRDYNYKEMWDKRRAEFDEFRAKGKCLIIFTRKHRFQVVLPKTDEFPDYARDLGGRYRPRTKSWTFPHYKHKEVMDVCNELFPGKVVVWGSPRIS